MRELPAWSVAPAPMIAAGVPPLPVPANVPDAEAALLLRTEEVAPKRPVGR